VRGYRGNGPRNADLEHDHSPDSQEKAENDMGSSTTLKIECKNNAAVASRFESKNPGWTPVKDVDNYDLIHVMDGGADHLKLPETPDWVVVKLADPTGHYNQSFKPLECNDGDVLQITGNDVNAYLYQNGKQVQQL
jgi:hypothetical protein